MNVEHLPIPPKGHRCEAVVREAMLTGLMERCACGAARYLDQFRPKTPKWSGRNIRLANQPRPYRRSLLVDLIRRLPL